MTNTLIPRPLRSVRLNALTLVLPLAAVVACDVEDNPEIETQAAADAADDIPDDLFDVALDVPEPGEGFVDDESRPLEFTAPDRPQAFLFLSPHSEETPGTSECPVNQVVTGFACAGDYCDNVLIECHSYGTSVPSVTDGFSDWFEVGQPWGVASGVSKQLHICDDNEKMTGIDCRGSYCDDIQIECSPAPGLGTGRCAWTPDWFSEEDSGFLAPVGSAIQGVWCKGQHCDDKRYWVCEV